jgi:hypothetical protein
MASETCSLVYLHLRSNSNFHKIVDIIFYLGGKRYCSLVFDLYIFDFIFFCRFGDRAFSKMLWRTCDRWGHWHLVAAYWINQQEYPWSGGFKACFVNSSKSCSLSSSARSADTTTQLYTDNRPGVTEVSIFSSG